MRVRAQVAILVAGPISLLGCGQGKWVPVAEVEDAVKTAASVRAERRLYDGAPPVIPHDLFGAACVTCHDAQGIAVDGVGFAPPSPHADTHQDGATSRCRQCHAPILAEGVFVENSFEGLRQDMRGGGRLYDGAPPTIPHKILMRENCAACHVGPGARAEIITTHPERTRCRQCHVPVETREGILSYAGNLGTRSEGS